MRQNNAYCGFLYSEKDQQGQSQWIIIWAHNSRAKVKGDSMSAGGEIASVRGTIEDTVSLINTYFPSCDPKNRREIVLTGERTSQNEYRGKWSSDTNGESGKFWLERVTLNDSPRATTETLLNLGL